MEKNKHESSPALIVGYTWWKRFNAAKRESFFFCFFIMGKGNCVKENRKKCFLRVKLYDGKSFVFLKEKKEKNIDKHVLVYLSEFLFFFFGFVFRSHQIAEQMTRFFRRRIFFFSKECYTNASCLSCLAFFRLVPRARARRTPGGVAF